jgi:AGCS family alanine or glycine:cation symporter
MVWGIADILNGLMAAPNLIALIILAPVVVRLIHNFEGVFPNS